MMLQPKFRAALLTIKGKQVWWVAQLEVDSPDVYRYICSCIDEITAVETAGELNAYYEEKDT